MADEEHVRRLKQGVDAWNKWRRDRGATIVPDLIVADLSGADLTSVNLNGANLFGANLGHATLLGADLHNANLIGANLSHADLNTTNLAGATLNGANLNGANLSGANLNDAKLFQVDLLGATLISADLSGVDLSSASLTGANLSGAHLTGARLISTRLGGTNLSGADLRNAKMFGASLGGTNLLGTDLSGADISSAEIGGANLSRADLSGADLMIATLRHSNLEHANLTNARLLETIFVDIDLTKAIGLETCKHDGPSILDHRTLQKSRGLPIAFLRGVGLPQTLIDALPALFKRVQFYSCFISYSTKDQDFADRIYDDLQNKGVRCWLAPHDMPIGGKMLDGINTAIRSRDKVLLILSEDSIKSDWVEDEVTTSFEEERKRGQTVLFPIRLDDQVMATDEAWAAKLRASRNIGDFRRWKDPEAYKKSFERVMRDLAVKPKDWV